MDYFEVTEKIAAAAIITTPLQLAKALIFLLQYLAVRLYYVYMYIQMYVYMSRICLFCW